MFGNLGGFLLCKPETFSILLQFLHIVYYSNIKSVETRVTYIYGPTVFSSLIETQRFVKKELIKLFFFNVNI